MLDQHLPTHIKVHRPHPICVIPTPTYPHQSPQTPTHLCQTNTYLPISKSTDLIPSVLDQHLTYPDQSPQTPSHLCQTNTYPNQSPHTPSQPISVRPAPTYPDQSPHTPCHLCQTNTYLPRSKTAHPIPSVSDQHLPTHVKVHRPHPICVRPTPTYPHQSPQSSCHPCWSPSATTGRSSVS